MSKEERIKKIIQSSLKTADSQEQYLNILNSRIDDNRKLMSRLFMVILLTAIAFPLLIETKISEISVGPFKIIDHQIAIGLIPTIFAFTYYKYLMVWIDLVEQKVTFKSLTSELFNVDFNSYLNERLKPFSITDSIINHHSQKKLDSVGCLSYLFWIPTALILLFFPFIFEFYLIKTLFDVFQRETVLDWIIFLTPIIIGIFTTLMFIQVVRTDLKKNKAST